MTSFGSGSASIPFSPHRRTAAILLGEGTAAAYLAGAMSALRSAGVRIDFVLGKGAGALIAALSAIDAEECLHGEDGLLARAGARRPWRLRPLYKMSLVCLAISFTAFLSPVLLGLFALLAIPLQAIGRQETSAPASAWLGAIFEVGAPLYLRAMAVPLIVLCAFWLVWWAASFVRLRRAPSLPELFDLEPLAALLETAFWRAVRGASSEERPPDRKALGEAHRKLLSGSLGQFGFRELVFYALDTDGGHEVAFAMLKERFLKKLNSNRTERRDKIRAEPIDLAGDGGALFFDALLAALSPPGLVPGVPIKLPLGTAFGGEVHRFSGSIFAGGTAVVDAVAAGAEQIIYITGCASFDRPAGNAWERLTEAALRKSLSDDLADAARLPGLPVYLIRSDKQRLRPLEITGRAQLGNERLDLSALTAHGRRDALRLFIEPVLGDEKTQARGESMVAAGEHDWKAGPSEL